MGESCETRTGEKGLCHPAITFLEVIGGRTMAKYVNEEQRVLRAVGAEPGRDLRHQRFVVLHVLEHLWQTDQAQVHTGT